MTNKIKFVHTNLIAKDWKRLAQFYIDVFDCVPVYPERELEGGWIDRITKIPNVTINGIHLQLPGFQDGPTLEIFQYSPESATDNNPVINDPGFSHIAFHVDNVEEVLQRLIVHGGQAYGELIEKEFAGIGLLRVIYATDLEGNIIEIQNWRKD